MQWSRSWWERDEYSESRDDFQAPPDFNDTGGADVAGVDFAVTSLYQTPLGEPPTEFDVRCVYDSRPVNGYDFNLSSAIVLSGSATSWAVTFNVPNGYRMVPREWQVIYDNPPAIVAANSTVSLQQNGAGVPNNQGIIIGSGTTLPIKSFYVCEENTTFGITGFVSTGNVTGAVNVYGNLIAVSEVALPFAVANRKYGT